MNEIKNLIKENIKNGEDFEFYPTTNEMIRTVFNDIKSNNILSRYNNISSFSMLDIGAGNGNVLNIVQDLIQEYYEHNFEDEVKYDRVPKITKYAIEKSKTLIEAMNDDIMVLGTEFYEQTLIDKKVDVIFCNPPYTQFKEWTQKIISEANCKIIYLIIPERWEKDEEIQHLIDKRLIKKNDEYTLGKVEILDETDFLDSEYRKARAKVQIIKIELEKGSYSSKTDPFSIWFDNEFKINADKTSYSYTSEKSTTEKTREEINELVQGNNLIEVLEELYNKDMNKLIHTYKALEELDYDLLNEMEINIANVKEKLKLKIEGLKNFYWGEFFGNLDKITERLTSSSREKMMDKLMTHTSIDFTASNCYAIAIWVIKNANKYIDEQLKEVYLDLANKKNIINYKSNQKVFSDDNWRFKDEIKFGKFKLDYRIVVSRYNNFNTSIFGNYEYPNGLNINTHKFLNDICTIALNLGFGLNANQVTNSRNIIWESGKKREFHFIDDNGESQPLMETKCYKNGNIHLKLNKEFIKKLNIEMGRLMGWVKSREEASEELDIPMEEINKYYNCNKKLFKNDIKLLTY